MGPQVTTMESEASVKGPEVPEVPEVREVPEDPVPRLSAALTDKLLPRLVSDGAFGQGWRVDGALVSLMDGFGMDHWASVALATTLELSKDGDKRSVALLAKWMLPRESFQGYSLPNVQAANEALMYGTVFPLFQRLADGTGVRVDDLHPRMYTAQCGMAGVEGGASLLLMEDLRARGFRLSERRTALDLDHAILVLRAAGRLHALSHAAKALRRAEFLAVAPRLREACYQEEWRPRTVSLHPFFRRGLDRLAGRLQDAVDADEDRHRRRLEGLRRMEALSADPHRILVRAVTPTEPNSVITHGDMCRNNMLFRYDEQGRPEEVCLYDFQNARYCTPVIDLSFFLWLNTSAALRDAHWDDLLRAYHVSLQTALDGLLKGRDVDEDFVMPPLEALRDELRQHALWGYVICAFFLPEMTASIEEQKAFNDLREASTVAEGDQAHLRLGGERSTDQLADMVLEFIDRGLVP